MATDPNIRDDERNDDDGDKIANRLAKVAGITNRAAARLDRIRPAFTEPPEPDKPAIIASLNEVVAAANHIMTIADQMLLIARGTRS
jgi:hypothetical protein